MAKEIEFKLRVVVDDIEATEAVARFIIKRLKRWDKDLWKEFLLKETEWERQDKFDKATTFHIPTVPILSKRTI
jgi:hypothetical protein